VIELAPNRKQGLTLSGPLIAASGAAGFGHAGADLLALDHFGAIVSAPISLRARRGSPAPRLVSLPGGMLLNHGGQNPGWHRVRDTYGAAWSRNKAPLILHLVGAPLELVGLAVRVEGTPGIAGIELDVDGEETLGALATLRTTIELPVLARLPYGGTSLAARSVEAGADALVCIAPPRGAALDFGSGQLIEGELYGPLVKAMTLHTLHAVRAKSTVPLIACGGVHSTEDVNELLAAGASAVMIDSLAWIDPNAVNAILAV